MREYYEGSRCWTSRNKTPQSLHHNRVKRQKPQHAQSEGAMRATQTNLKETSKTNSEYSIACRAQCRHSSSRVVKSHTTASQRAKKAVRALTHNGGRGKKERASLRHSHNRAQDRQKSRVYILFFLKSHSKLRHWIHAAPNFTSIRTGASCDQGDQCSELQEKGRKRWQQRRAKRAPFLRGREEPGRIRTAHTWNTLSGP